MKNLNCHGGHNVTTLPGRVIWFAGGGEAPKLPDKESQKVFSEITKTVQDLENEKSNVKEEHDKVVDKLVQMLKDKPEYFSPELLRALAKRTEVMIRVFVAHNPNTPADTLRELSKDKNAAVRGNVAYNSNTPVDVLREFAKDKDPNARESVVLNPSTPADVLRELAKDKNGDIAERAKARLEKI